MKSNYSPKTALICAYSDCRDRSGRYSQSPASGRIVRKGSFYRNEDARWIPRFRCLDCRRSFSASRLLPCFGHKKRSVNLVLPRLLCSGVSQRRAALLLGINPKTVVRKLLYAAALAKQERTVENDRLVAKGVQLDALQWPACAHFI